MAWCDISFFSIASVSCVKLFSANNHNGSRDIYCTWYGHFHTRTQIRSSRHNFLFRHVNSTHLVTTRTLPECLHFNTVLHRFDNFSDSWGLNPYHSYTYFWCIQFRVLICGIVPITCNAYACSDMSEPSFYISDTDRLRSPVLNIR